MTIRPTLCPLDTSRRLGASGHDSQHVHDDCLCLDQHSWRRSIQAPGAQLCDSCGAARCGVHRGPQRCVRRTGHGRRHLFARG